MKHPVFKKTQNLLIYTLSWIPLAGIQFLLIRETYGQAFSISLIQALVNTYLFALLGILIWYMVYYSNTPDKWSLNMFLNHLILAVLFLYSWHELSDYIIGLITESTPDRYNYIKMVLGIFSYLLLLFAFIFIRFNSEMHEKMMHEEKLNRSLRESELKALKNQINPHFLFNSLNSLSSLTSYAPERAREMIIKLSDYLRYSLKQNESQLVTLIVELEKSLEYLEIEKIRFEDKLLIETTISEELKSWKVPAMILQPIYENAVKHGVYESLTPVTIRTEITETDGRLNIKISNQFDSEAIPRRGEGIGLKNIKERLNYLYGSTSLLSFKKEEQIFMVNLEIPKTI